MPSPVHTPLALDIYAAFCALPENANSCFGLIDGTLVKKQMPSPSNVLELSNADALQGSNLLPNFALAVSTLFTQV